MPAPKCSPPLWTLSRTLRPPTAVGPDGQDISTGGAGADQFTFTGQLEPGSGANRDLITDFGKGDLVDLHRVTSGLVFIGNAAFSGTATEIRHTTSGGLLPIDSNGDGIQDDRQEFTNHAALTAASLVLA